MMSIKISKKDKMLEICEFLNVGLSAIFRYQYRNKKSETGKINKLNKLGFRLLMNADIKTLEFFLNDNNFTQDYFLADEPDVMKLNIIKYDDREIYKKSFRRDYDLHLAKIK